MHEKAVERDNALRAAAETLHGFSEESWEAAQLAARAFSKATNYPELQHLMATLAVYEDDEPAEEPDYGAD